MHQLKEDSPMSRRLVVAMLGLGPALFLMPQFLLAAEDHIAEAIADAKQAIDHGKMGHPSILATHAELALTHATASERRRPTLTPKKRSNISNKQLKRAKRAMPTSQLLRPRPH